MSEATGLNNECVYKANYEYSKALDHNIGLYMKHAPDAKNEPNEAIKSLLSGLLDKVPNIFEI